MSIAQHYNTGDSFCSICLDPVTDRADAILAHVQNDHYENDKFQNFIHSVVIRQLCANCGVTFYSDVDAVSKTTFAARPYCKQCRAESRAFEKLMTDKLDASELVSRGMYRPELALTVRTLDTD